MGKVVPKARGFLSKSPPLIPQSILLLFPFSVHVELHNPSPPLSFLLFNGRKEIYTVTPTRAHTFMSVDL